MQMTFHPSFPFAAALLLGATLLPHAAHGAPPPDDARQHELRRLVRDECGSCHGLTLRGGLGPALTPDRLAPLPAESLAATILYGRPGTAMPPWRRFLGDAEAQWIVEELRRGLPALSRP